MRTRVMNNLLIKTFVKQFAIEFEYYDDFPTNIDNLIFGNL